MQIGVRTHWCVEKALAKRKGGISRGGGLGPPPSPTTGIDLLSGNLPSCPIAFLGQQCQLSIWFFFCGM